MVGRENLTLASAKKYWDKSQNGELRHVRLESKLPSDSMRSRYETPEIWRSDNVFDVNDKAGLAEPERPAQPPASKYNSMANYLQQTLVSDYPSIDTDDIFVMLKTGGTTMWNRLPIHLFTTLTRVKNFAIYSDLAGSIGGYEVIDILKDLPEDILDHDQLASYRLMRKVRNELYRWDVSEIDFHNRKDGWSNDKFKNLPMLVDAYRRSPDSKWFVYLDDDSYIIWENLVQILDTMDPNELILMGNQGWRLNINHHGETMHHFAHGGSGVIISKAAMDHTFGDKATQSAQDTVNHWSRTALSHCCGDILASWVFFEMANVTLDSDKHPERPYMRFQGAKITTTRLGEENWCEPLVSFHHLDSHSIEVLWEYERLQPRGEQILGRDFYRDFVLPYVVEERENWFLQESLLDTHTEFVIKEGQNLPFTDKDGVEIFPHYHKDHCRRACEAKDTCMIWSQFSGACYLLEDYAVLGARADLDLKDFRKVFGTSSKVYTGWMVDRIRQVRAKAPCDPLEYDPETGLYNDTPLTSEGWALRDPKQNLGIAPMPRPHEGIVVPEGAPAEAPAGAANP